MLPIEILIFIFFERKVTPIGRISYDGGYISNLVKNKSN